MRRLVFGFGSVEYLACVGAIAGFFGVVTAARINWQSGLVIGLGFAMSSDAIALPILEVRNEIASPHGRLTIAADIFQSLMLIPVLAVIPLLGNVTQLDGNLHKPGIWEVLAALVAVLLLGRVILPYWLGLILRVADRGAFTLAVFACVFAAAWVMQRVGISMALGAFMMGVLLSTSAFSNEVKAAVTPARQWLLGVFFVAVGMAIDLKEVASFREELLLYVTAVLLIKVGLIYAAARTFKFDPRAALLGGLLLMPLDEIGYVIFASAQAQGLLSVRGHALALSAISFSFLVSPIAINFGLRLAGGAKPSKASSRRAVSDAGRATSYQGPRAPDP
jgi:glutathione-regulated potassium-efflux system protein KefB